MTTPSIVLTILLLLATVHGYAWFRRAIRSDAAMRAGEDERNAMRAEMDQRTRSLTDALRTTAAERDSAKAMTTEWKGVADEWRRRTFQLMDRNDKSTETIVEISKRRAGVEDDLGEIPDPPSVAEMDRRAVEARRLPVAVDEPDAPPMPGPGDDFDDDFDDDDVDEEGRGG